MKQTQQQEVLNITPEDRQELWRDDDGFIAQGTGGSYKTFADTNVNDDDIDDRERRTDLIIAAYNGTIAKGYNPAAMDELYNVAVEFMKVIDGISSVPYGTKLTVTIPAELFERASTALQNSKL